ncbi:MAG: endonuclease [Desulfuromonadaceae bacterium GWC2_58_13]|nr:MAG: endonuclease [Desulfuromonadaceae bacterium GWC2_58_13]
MKTSSLEQVFERLLDHFGPLHWWPADTPFEVVIGAILTQNTAWTNVEKAIVNLRLHDGLTPDALRAAPRKRLEDWIRPAGFFRQKAERLQLFTEHLFARHGGDLRRMLAGPLAEVREELLALKGIGPETADSILLYAGGRPSFVVDAYTRRLFGRLQLLDADAPYEHIRAFFMDRLPADSDLFNEYHALIVEHCKRLCRKQRPLCPECCLLDLCPFAKG